MRQVALCVNGATGALLGGGYSRRNWGVDEFHEEPNDKESDVAGKQSMWLFILS